MTVSFAKETITRRRYPFIDDLGTSVPNLAGEPVDVPITRCWLVPITSTENEEGGLTVLSGYDCVAPWNTDLLSTDHVFYDGVEWEMAGDVMKVKSPTGALNEVKFSIRRWNHAG